MAERDDETRAQAASPEDLFRTYGPVLRRYLVSRIRNEADASDIAQEAFIRFSQVPDAEAIENPQGYLFRIAANLAGRFLKTRSAEPIAVDLDVVAETAEGSDGDAFERAIEARSAIQQLDQILSQLPPLYRAVLLLRKRDGLSHSEIAEKLEIPTHTVHHYLTKALARCREDWTE